MDRMATDDEILGAAKNQDGSPRFYRPGQHPATYRMRKHRAHVERLFPDTPERQKMLDYIDRKLAEFEKGDDESKRLYLRAVRRGD